VELLRRGGTCVSIYVFGGILGVGFGGISSKVGTRVQHVRDYLR
jgi:hypothetical protein